jgi:hypothetical protein
MEGGIRNDRVVVLRGDASETDGLPHEYGDAFGLHLLHDLSAIAFDGPHTDIQLGGNGVTRKPLHDEIEDFDLSRGQSRELQTEILLRLPEILLLERPRKCPVDRRHELGIVHRFFDKVFRSRLDRRHRHRHIGMTRNKDDGKRDLSTTEFADEFYSVCTGHPHISYDATRTRLLNRLKKCVGRIVGLDGESEHAEHLAECMPDRLVIVYDKDRRCSHRYGTSD